MSKRDPTGGRPKRKRGDGVPRSVQRRPGGKPVVELDISAARETWLLDILAWCRHGAVAARIDVRGSRAALPPVILPDVGGGRVVALETAAAIDRLRSRHRAFSQIAGRYAPLVIGARDAGQRLCIEVWRCTPDGDDIGPLCAQLAEYLDADITQHTLVEATAALRSAPWPTAPAELTARNPLAWLRALDQGAS